MKNTAEVQEASPSNMKKRTSKRLGIREFILTLIIIFVVWAARKCFSDNRLTGDASSPHQLPVTAATMPVSSEDIEDVLIAHSSKVGAQYRAEYAKLFQLVLEVDYAEEKY